MNNISLVIEDRFLFKANENINSRFITITILKQISVIVSIILGIITFKEKDII